MKKILILLTTLALSNPVNAVDFNQCIKDVAENVRETLNINSDKSLSKSTRDWFCEDTKFDSYLKKNKDAEVVILIEGVPVKFKYGESKEKNISQRRTYCQDNQFSMNSRDLYTTVRSVLNKDYVLALDTCVKGLAIVKGVNNPIEISLQPKSSTKVLLKMKATPRSFGEIVPIVTGLTGNIACPALPSRGIPLSLDFYETICSYNLKVCEVGFVNLATSTGKSAEGSFFVPKRGSLGKAYVTYDEATLKWVFDEKASVSGHTNGGNLECDDDGSYEGGFATGSLSASVAQGRKISTVNGITCSGGAHWTCTSSWHPNSARQVEANIKHHSCGGSPRFTMTYTVEKQIEENINHKSEESNITAGGSTSLIIPANAINVAVVIEKTNGEKVVISDLNIKGSSSKSNGFSASRISTGINIYASEDCQ